MIAASELFGCALAAFVGEPLADSSLRWGTGINWLVVGAFAAIWLFEARLLGLYSRSTLVAGGQESLARGLMACASAIGLLLLLAFISNLCGSISRTWFLGWITGVFAMITATRLFCAFALGRALNRGACIERAIVLAQTDEAAAQMAEALWRESEGRIGVAFAMTIPNRPEAIAVIEHGIRDNRFERVVICGFEQAGQAVRALMARLSLVAVEVTIIPSLDHLGGSASRVERVGSLPAVDLVSRPLTSAQELLKRCEDLFLAVLALVLLAPLMALIALGIRLDSRGPVLFRQSREGYNGRSFELLKFRTMFADQSDRAAARQTSRGDPRVTRFGAILRRTSLDELPQLINVLLGDMSVVGPRPHALGMTALGRQMREVIETYGARHRIRPGITGWAQVRNCRGEINTEEKLRRRVSLDCEYIESWSLVLDFWIIFRTLWLVINDNDAY